MKQNRILPQILITIVVTSSLFISSSVHAEVFKWRDNKGVIQYSDKAPITSNKTKTRFTTTTSAKKTMQSPTRGTTSLRMGESLSTLSFSRTKPTKTPKPILTSPTPTTPTPIVTTPLEPVIIAPTAPTPVVTAPLEPIIVAPTPAPAPIEPLPTLTGPIINPNIIQTGLQPSVDISKNIIPAIGFSDIRIEPSSVTYPPSAGEFRIGCGVSHMSNDDPLVYPNQQGAAHHHTFFGNTSLNYKSDLYNLSATGNSTCRGGIANRSAYWIPSVIDTLTNTPIVPDDTGFYYKSGLIDGAIIVAPPKGLRMIAGNSKAKTTTESNEHAHYSCLPGPNSPRNDWPWNQNIPSGANCEMGDMLVMSIGFPQCWDGKNLDSPNHQDHMAYPSHRTDSLPNFYCPATHPVAIPNITMNVTFKIKTVNQTASWRLASDNYSTDLPGGYSTHADWVNGWDTTIMDGIIKNCINAKRDGHSHLLCDGRTLY